MQTVNTVQKPQLHFLQIWNMCFGFLGIQFGFALQNANVSRIFQTLGAEIDQIPILWVAAPLTGLLVQPIIGYMSDRTWTRLGRRRPYFLYGALLTTVALIIMPHSATLWIAAGMLWILDASINITMEPFRAFVGDMLPSSQRATGYLMQSFFIGVGAIIASALPWILSNGFNVAASAPLGEVPDAVRYSFYFGAVVLFTSVAWTVLSTREYSPEQLATFEPENQLTAASASSNQKYFNIKTALIWLTSGIFLAFCVDTFAWNKQLYLICGGAIIYGIFQALAHKLETSNRRNNPFYEICESLATMPQTMRRLAWVQFFSWTALFAMWIYTTAAVTDFHYHSIDPSSAAYNEGANWVGVLFAAYNGFAAIAAMVIPTMVKRFGAQGAHQINLGIGALSFLSFLIIRDPHWLLLSMVGVGFAWASILSIPYALLADALPANKMGIYMGIFNFFIVIPQLLAASLLGLFIKFVAGGSAIYVFVLGAVLWILAALAVSRVKSLEVQP